MRGEEHRYDDIINEKRPVSTKHPNMSLYARSAQFAPFAALTGYGDAVYETARLTEKKIDLDEVQKESISRVLNEVQDKLVNKLDVTIKVCFFVPDKRKDGGMYVESIADVKKIDDINKVIKLKTGEEILIDNISSLEII